MESTEELLERLVTIINCFTHHKISVDQFNKILSPAVYLSYASAVEQLASLRDGYIQIIKRLEGRPLSLLEIEAHDALPITLRNEAGRQDSSQRWPLSKVVAAFEAVMDELHRKGYTKDGAV